MKKAIAVSLAFLLLFLCGCGSKEPVETTTRAPKTADMLDLPSNKKNYAECLKRYYAVVSAVKNKIQMLETEHNKSLEIENPDSFFLDEDFIATGFDPFIFESLSLTESFTTSMDSDQAAELYSSVADGAAIRFEKNTENSFILRFIEEESTREYIVDYSSSDSFRYISRSESDGNSVINETLEFTKTGNTYYIQSRNARLFVQFDTRGNILNFCCSTLRNGDYSNEVIYPKTDKTIEWAVDRNKDDYLNIHTYQNGTLIHEDSSSGPWQTVTVTENK